ncbi:hypothetical protein RIF29_21008 [Crotalaria pallida]|uniref:Uncharacterized protein n=1 Tax=Crotalaria pallida TaxID=3830 RepID=A0AAN9F3N8_CROPI
MAEEVREAKQDNRTMKRILLMINCIILAIGASGGPLISRLYFLHGGNRVWLSSFLQAAGFPIILLPLFISFFIRSRQITSSFDSSKVKMVTMKLPLFVFSAIIGVIIALDIMCFFAALFSLVGMIANNDFKVIPREAKHFRLGETAYYVVLIGIAIIWQMNYLGAIGVVFCASSLFSGVCVSLMVPIIEILAIIFYKEKFTAEKGVSLILSIWGFVSYFYGEYKQAKKMKKNQVPTNEFPQNHSTSNL